MDAVDKRLDMLNGFMSDILERNATTLNKLKHTLTGIKEYKKYCDEDFVAYLDIITGILVQNSRGMEQTYNLFIEEIDNTIDFFGDDLEYMKLISEADLNSLDVWQLYDEIKNRAKEKEDTERQRYDYCQETWSSHHQWMYEAEMFLEEFKYFESRGELNEEDYDYMRDLKKSLLYNRIIFDRLDRKGDIVDASTFANMWNQEVDDEPPPF